MKKILVTGGCGFIGSYLVDTLVAEGYSVSVLDNLSSESSSEENVNPYVKYYFGDIHNIDIILNFEQFDEIYHLAAEARIQPSFDHPVHWFKENALGTMKVLEYARRSKSGIVVYATTSSKTHGIHHSPYTLSKVVGEEILKMYHEAYGIKCVSATFHNVYGPGEPDKGEWATVVAKFLRQYRNGQKLTVVGTGDQERDFTHVADICEGLMALGDFKNWPLEIYPDGRNFDLGKGEAISIIDLARYIVDGIDSKIDFVPFRKNEGQRTLADVETTYKYFNFRANRSLFDYINFIKQQIHKL